MIKARAGSFVLLGLTRANCERLLQGQPIRVSGDDPVIGLPGTTILIMAGETEAAIEAELRGRGVVAAVGWAADDGTLEDLQDAAHQLRAAGDL